MAAAKKQDAPLRLKNSENKATADYVKSLKSGLNAGLQGLEYAKMLLENCKSKQVVVVACDELTKSKMELYSALKYFRSDESEKDFRQQG